jgi:hypothetical protein
MICFLYVDSPVCLEIYNFFMKQENTQNFRIRAWKPLSRMICYILEQR